MKRLLVLLTCATALVLVGTAAAALEPGVYDPGNTGCPTATYSDGALHLAKNCPTATNAAAYGAITGLSGQTFTSASFTLASAAQCQGGSPRFNIVTTTGTFFLGCNNVTPTTNSDGSVTYTFNAATIAAGGGQVPFPTGTITDASVILDVQGSADVSKITVNGTSEVPHPGGSGHHPKSENACKHGDWKKFHDPSFKNQGQCIKYVEHHKKHEESHSHTK